MPHILRNQCDRQEVAKLIGDVEGDPDFYLAGSGFKNYFYDIGGKRHGYAGMCHQFIQSPVHGYAATCAFSACASAAISSNDHRCPSIPAAIAGVTRSV